MEDEILNDDALLEKEEGAEGEEEFPAEPNICDCGECAECIKTKGECTCGDCDVCIKVDADKELEAEDLYDDVEQEDMT